MEMESLTNERKRQHRYLLGSTLITTLFLVSFHLFFGADDSSLADSPDNDGTFLRHLNIFHPGDAKVGAIISGESNLVTSLYQTTNLYPQSGDRASKGAVCGAIQAVLAHPTDADICFAGAVNGGVWRTKNCRADYPDWKPLTDYYPSNSIADMEFDENDPNTLLVAIGHRSADSMIGGRRVGLYMSKNALADKPTWRVLNITVQGTDIGIIFNEVFVRGNLLMATSDTSYAGEVWICDTIGLWRSTDGGATWANVLRGKMYALANDPANPTHFYAAGDNLSKCGRRAIPRAIPNGVYKSVDSGATWSTTGYPALTEGLVEDAKISVSAAGSRVWAGMLVDGKADVISYSDDGGTTWTAMDQISIPGDDTDGLDPKNADDNKKKLYPSRGRNFALFAPAGNIEEIYVAGDRQDTYNNEFPNYLGAQGYTGRIFRGDASVTATNGEPSPQWEHMTDSENITTIPDGGTASGSAPHAGTRDFAMRADGSLLVGDDGGITVRTNPSDKSGDWFSLCGNLQAFEIHKVAYEPRLKSIIYGVQGEANFVGKLGVSGSFASVGSGDGNDVMIDYKSSDQYIYYYFAAQYLYGATRLKRDKETGQYSEADETILTQIEGKGAFLSKMAMNPANQKIIAAAVTGGANGTTPNHVALSQNRGDSFTFHELTDPITALAFSANGRYLYLNTAWIRDGLHVNAMYQCKVGDWKCSFIGTPPTKGFVRQIVVNPNKRHRIYIISTASQTNVRGPKVNYYNGWKWKDITINLWNADLLGGAMSYISRRRINTIVVATSKGILVPNGRVGTRFHTEWKIMAMGIPVVPVTDMVYDAEDDLLVLGTMGRGIWYLKQASQYVGKRNNIFNWLFGWVFREEDDHDSLIIDDTTTNANANTMSDTKTTADAKYNDKHY